MKKALMLIIAVSLCYCMSSQAQQTSDPNSGHFDIIKNTSKGAEHINVNYVLQPAPFVNTMHMYLNTPNPMKLSVKIVNTAGAVVLNWMPDQVGYSYEHDFDISGLNIARYRMDIYGENNTVVHSVYFNKRSGN